MRSELSALRVERAVPVLVDVRQGIVATPRPLRQTVEERHVVDVDPVHRTVPMARDVEDQLVLAPRIPLGVADRHHLEVLAVPTAAMHFFSRREYRGRV